MKMRKKTNDLKDTPIIDTFKGLLLMSMGVPVGNICPYRLKSAPSCFCGFERMNVATARAAGVDIPETGKPDEEVYVHRLGPAVFCEWMPAWMFEAAFEPVPRQQSGDRIRTLTEEMDNYYATGKSLNEKAYALSVELLSEHGGDLRAKEDDEMESSVYIHVEDRDPVELVIGEVSLWDDGKITVKGHGYYTGEEHEQVCDVELGMDILNFILACTGQQNKTTT